MKKVLLEYANLIAYTITGLIFGLSFFLIFINFYHMEEINTPADVSAYNATNKQLINDKIATIKNNISVYDQSSYTGSLNIYGLNTAKIKLEECVKALESEDLVKYFDQNTVYVKDVYDFSIDFKNIVLNDCLVMQLKSMFSTDTVATLPNYNIIKPYVDLNIDNLLDSSSYVQSNLENVDHYYFSTDINKANFFDLTEDSYADIMNTYQNSLDLLVEVSNWYRSVVVGG